MAFGNGERDFGGMGYAFGLSPDLYRFIVRLLSRTVEEANPLHKHVAKILPLCAVNDTVSTSVGIRG